MHSGRWTAGLSEEEKKKFEDYLDNSQILLDKLHKICYNMCIESENKTNNYDNPNWAFMVADSTGYRRALKHIMTLCKQQDANDNG